MKTAQSSYRKSLPLMMILAFPILISAVPSADFPTLQTETLTKQEFEIPEDLPPKPALLIIGFTKDSRNQSSAWSNQLRELFAEGKVAVFDILVIEDAPRFIRGFIVRSMRKQTPESLHTSFLTVSKDAAALKKWVGYANTDDAFVVLLDKIHQPIWQTQGACEESKLQEITNHLVQLNVNVPSKVW